MIMTDTFADRLSEFLDGELAPDDRAAMDAHLAGCEGCRTTLDELRRVVARASRVQDSAPARDLWPGVAARIGTTPGARGSVFSRFLTSRLTFTLPQLAAASLALMVLSGGLVWMAKSGDPRADFQPLSAETKPQAGMESTNTPDGYDRAIAQLEKALDSRRGNLDPETLRALDRDIAAADRTLDESRRALAADPANVQLQAGLAKAQQRKLSLLRTALSEATRRKT